MKDAEIKKIEKTLDDLYENFDDVRRETIETLGKDAALHIINYQTGNWIDIINWISQKYDQKDLNNMVYLQFTRIFKETIWLQFLFHSANYPLIYRNLRYLLEMMAQAYYIDMKYPKANLDEQFEKIIKIEDNIHGWNLVQSVLARILHSGGGISEDLKSNQDQSPETIKEEFHQIWIYLNKHAHPSAAQMNFDLTLEKDFSTLVTDSFSKSIALSALKLIDKIFDIIYIIIFTKFNLIKELCLRDKFVDKWEKHSPITIKLLRES
jgi:hypothetical protein